MIRYFHDKGWDTAPAADEPLAPASALAVMGGVIDLDPNMPILTGRGYNSLAASIRGNAIDPQPIVSPEVAGANTTYRLDECFHYRSLRRSLGLSMAASLGIEGIALDGKAQFYQSVQLNSYDYFVFAHVRTTFALTQLASYRLRSQALEYYRSGGEQEFVNKYGDTFVAGILTGGELLAVIQVRVSSTEERARAEREIGGSFGFFRGSDEFRAALERIEQSFQSSVFVLKRGGSDEVLPDGTPLSQAASLFPAAARARPVAFSASLMEYDVADDMPPGWKGLRSQLRQMESLLELRDRAETRLEDIGWIRRSPQLFQGAAGFNLDEAEARARQLLSNIRDVGRQLIDCPFVEAALPQAEALALPLPPVAALETLRLRYNELAAVNGIMPTAVFHRGEAGWCITPNGQEVPPAFLCGGIFVEPPAPGIGLRYRVLGISGMNAGRQETPWIACGTGASIKPPGQPAVVNQIAFKLDDELAARFRIRYETRAIKQGIVQTDAAADGGWCPGNEGAGVFNYRVWIERR